MAAYFLVCGAAFAAGVPWVNLGPGGGGWIMSIAASPHDRNVVIAGGDTEGVFLSHDGGQTWEPRNTGLHDPWVEAILFHPTDPRVIFIGGKSGVHKSTDGGQTWTWLRNGFPPLASFSYSAPVGSLVADPSAPDTIYAGIGSQRLGEGAQGAIYKTTDGGDRWLKVNKTGIPADALITALLIHPAATTHLYASSNKGIYESLDSGVTWTGLNTGLPLMDVRYLVVAKSNPKVLYATLRTPTVTPWLGGVYKSTDGGQNWLAINNGLSQKTNSVADPHLWSEYYRLVVDPVDERIVYVGTTDFVTNTLFKTVDGGANWLPILTSPQPATFDRGWNTAFGQTVECLAMSPLDSKLLFFGDAMYIYKTPDAGTDWQQLFTRRVGANWQTNGLETIQSWMVSVDPSNPSRLFFGYADVGLWVSEDGGQSFLGYHMPPRGTFNGVTEDVFGWAVALDPADPNHIWAILHEAGRVYESFDGSVSWTLQSSGLPTKAPGKPWRRKQLLLDTQTRRLLANVDGKGIYASSNGGASWSPSSSGLPPDAEIRDLTANPADPNIYWCLLEGSGSTPATVYRSTDRGATWTLVSDASLRAFDVFQLVVSATDPRRLFLSARQPSSGGVSFPGGIYASADGGVSWTRILNDSCLSMSFCSGPYTYAVAVDPTDANFVYAGLKDDPYHDDNRGGGLSLSTDGGTTWAPIDDNLPTHCILTITIDPADRTRVYVGTCGNGVFRLDLTATIVSALKCSYSINYSGQAFPSQGGTGTITISTGAGCPWTVGSLPAGVKLISSGSGAGTGSIAFQVFPNAGGSVSSSVTIADQTFNIEQSAASIAGLAAAGSLGQVASEGTWNFTLDAINLGASTATARFTFADNNGNPLLLPLTFPQSAPAAGPLLAATLDRTLNPNAQIVMNSTGPDSAATLVGSGQLLSNGSVSGFGIFSNPKVHWNAVVPLETRNASKYILAFDNTAPLTTGVAVASLAAQAQNVTAIVKDDNGAQIGSNATISLSSRGHTSFMLNTPPAGFPSTTGKRGTIEFDTPPGGELSVLGLRANGPALTTLPVLANVGTNGGSITHVAFNGGWTSVFYIVNTGSAAAQFTLSFSDENGIALPVPLVLPQSATNITTAALTQTLAAGAMLVVNTQAQDSQLLVVGSAQLTTTGNISGFEIFRWTTFGQEASVPMETRTPNSFVLVFDDTNGLTTGVALANLNATAANITVLIYDDAGTLLQTTPLKLESRVHTQFLLPDKYDATKSRRGMVEFVVPQGAKISAIGLRAKSDGTLTTIPVLTK